VDVATAFVNIYDAPQVSQLLVQANAMRALWVTDHFWPD
jgi:hypothetical protein